jgi:hypothetical protein
MSAASNFVRVQLDDPQPPASGSDSSSPSPSSPSSSSASSLSSPSSPSSSPSQPGPPAPHPHAASLPRRLLLCNMRALLKKLSTRVLVGDRVRVGAVDWALGRGTVEEVLPRRSELVDPAVANVDHALLVFALANPPVSARPGPGPARQLASSPAPPTHPFCTHPAARSLTRAVLKVSGGRSFMMTE